MKPIKYVIPALAAFLLVMSASCTGGKKEQATVEAPPVPVVVQKPEVGTITDWYRTTCELRSPLEAYLSFGTGGKVLELAVDEGDTVTEGQYLGKVDTSTLAAQHSAALSGAASAESQARAAGLAAEAADAQVEQARAALDKMEADYNRFKTLYEEGVATQSEFEQMELGYQSAQLALQAARSGADASWAQARAAELGATAASSQAAQVAELIADGTLRAPFGGRIASRMAEPGDMAGPGVPVFRLVGEGDAVDNRLEVRFSVPEVLVGSTYVGMPLYVNLLSCEREIETAIDTLGPEVHEDARTVSGIAYIPLDAQCLLPGMFGTVRIPLETHDNAVKLPEEAVIELETEQFVYVSSGDVAQKRPVTLGLREEGMVEIVSGVNPDDDVIVAGNRYLSDGAKIVLSGTPADSTGTQGGQS
jgi:multidrug efflux pump subunit AcrA (membrane-fusion protein)